MKKLTLLLFVMFCLFGTMVCQSNMVDVVKLKNGNILKGVIVEQVPNEYIKLKTVDGNVWTFDTMEIAKITREEQGSSKGGSTAQSQGGNKQADKTKEKRGSIRPGRLQLLEISQDIMFGRGFGKSNMPNEYGNFYFTRIDYIRGRQFGQVFSIGFNTGFNLGYGNYAKIEEIPTEPIVKDNFFTFSVPAILDLRFYILKGPIVPYIGVNGGLEVMYYYSDRYSDYFAPLVTFTPRIGCNFTIGKGVGLNIFAGYKGMYSLRGSVKPFGDRYYNGMNFGIGLRM